MKAYEKKVDDLLNEEFLGHPSRKEEHDIRQIKKILLLLAQGIDDSAQYGT